MIDLKELEKAGEAAVRKAYDKRQEYLLSQDPVNWGDIHCRWAEEYKTSTGDRGYRVYLEEAAPSASHLQRFVALELEDAGYPDIEVVTDW